MNSKKIITDKKFKLNYKNILFNVQNLKHFIILSFYSEYDSDNCLTSSSFNKIYDIICIKKLNHRKTSYMFEINFIKKTLKLPNIV